VKKLIVFAIGFLVALSIGTAGAYFTDEVSVQDNVVRAGEVEVSVEPTSAALGIEALAPGSTVARTLDVRNAGTLGSTVVITGAKRAGYTDFYEALTCRVMHGGTVIYDGAMSDLKTAPVEIGPAGSARLEFHVGLPAAAGNDLAGDYVRMTLYVNAEQVHE
jgi:predicted ribosomally synthesized peptide with SipW-like signal peptide